MKIKKSDMVSQERNRERKFSRSSSSSGKRTRDSQVESLHSTSTRGRWQGPTMAPGSGRGLQPDKMTDLNARIVTKIIMVLVDE